MGNYCFCKLLIENNADVNVAEENTRHTPLHYALFDPWNPVLAESLLRRGANPYAQNVAEETPWEMAQRREDARILFQKFVKKK
jgi:ankyrin repeat protein